MEHPAAAPLNLQTPAGAEIVVDGRKVISFAASPYLGIAREPSLIEAGVDALRRFGARAFMPPSYGLVTQPHLDVEAEAADFFGTTAAIYLSSGYLLGMTALTGLRARFDVVILDADAHYNLRDAAAASGARVRTFASLDCDALEAELRRAQQESLRACVAVDGMCPTFGTLPRLDVYAELAERFGALLFIDESHSFGTLGATGRGAAEECGLSAGQALRGGSLGKAFCAAGAVIVGSVDEVTPLRSAPCVHGTSAGMVAGAAMAAASLRWVREHPELLIRLRANTKRLKAGLRAMGVELKETPAPLATFLAGSAADMQQLQQRLFAEGLFVLHMRYVGTSPDGVIRCSVFADHTDEHIDRLLEALRRLL
jgi:8-amino-7-oxononanoate synthase